MKALRWITLRADVAPIALELRRIAEALERLSPPPGPDEPVPEADQLTWSSEDAAILRELQEASGQTVPDDEDESDPL